MRGIIIVFKMEVMKMPKIIPIKELKNTSEISEMCHKSNEPVYVTKNGYGDMVIMSMEAFEGISERLKMYQSVLVKLFCNTLFDKYLTVTSLHRC